MKSEERHKLHSNEIEQITQSIGRFFEKHGRTVLIGLLVTGAVIVGIVLWVKWSRKSKAEGWTQFSVANDSEAYETIADKYPNTAVGAWARLRAAERMYGNAVKIYFDDNEAGRTELKKALEAFTKALDSKAALSSEALRMQALFGKARTLEALSDGDTGPAVKAYEQFLSDYPDSLYKKAVADRIELLKSERAKEFYAVVASFERKRADIQAPKDQQPKNPLLPPGHPSIGPPNEPPVSFPTLPEPLTEGFKPPEPKKPEKNDAKPFPETTPKKDGDEKQPAKTAPAKTKPAKTPQTSPAKTPAKTGDAAKTVPQK